METILGPGVYSGPLIMALIVVDSLPAARQPLVRIVNLILTIHPIFSSAAI
jgi:hypothetical protein